MIALPSKSDELPDQKIKKRRDDALRRALSTPPLKRSPSPADKEDGGKSDKKPNQKPR